MMTSPHDRVDEAAARLQRVRDEQLASLSDSPAAQSLCEEVVAMDRTEATATKPSTSSSISSRNAGRGGSGGAPQRPRRRRGLAIGWATAAAVLVVAGAVLGVVFAMQGAPADAAVQFTESGGFIVATVQDPFAAKERLDAAFAANGLDIDLKLLPVSPSIVGSVVFMEGTGIETTPSPERKGPAGALPVTLRIPADFKGHAAIVLGRAARPGEQYESAGDAFAEGECLHGVALVGMTAEQAVAKLNELGIRAQWRAETWGDETAPEAVPVPTPTPTASASAAAGPSDGSSPSPASPTVDASAAPDQTQPSPTATAGKIKTGRCDVVTPDKIAGWYVTGAVPWAPDEVVIFAQEARPDSTY
jgi:hypothetical protein